MIPTLAAPALRGAFRHSPWDALPVALAAGHGALLLLAPAAPVVAVGLWWNSNTVSHLFLHRPFFRSRAANRLFACYLTLVLGIPQTVWRDMHLAHHAGGRGAAAESRVSWKWPSSSASGRSCCLSRRDGS